MEPRQTLFWEIKSLLQNAFTDRLTVSSDGSFLHIEETGFWIGSNPNSLLVGFEYYYENYNNSDIEADPEQIYQSIFKLLTNRIKITKYFKGKQMFKTKLELEINEDHLQELGSEAALLFYYWRKTTTKIEFRPKIIEKSLLQHYRDKH